LTLTTDNRLVATIVASILLLIGLVVLIFGPWIARLGVSLLYSREDLAAVSGPVHRRVKHMRVLAVAGYAIVGAAFVAAGISALTG
jgi:hypothetical protein